jgi:hypothetical protein
MLDFSSIFERHFFSNHSIYAIEVEEVLEARLLGCECVTFSSFAALLVSIADEMLDASHHLLNISTTINSQSDIVAVNRFLSMTSRPTITALANEEKKKWQDESRSYLCAGGGLKMDVILASETAILAGVVNLSGGHDMLTSSGVFVTKHADLAEKIRWSRSSYGRHSSANIKIAANGRFSEFQAIIAHHLLDPGFDGSTK